MTNENIILAGGVSSGMFKSTNGGQSWQKTTAPDQLHSVTALAQNTTRGKGHIWYYGTGEGGPTSDTRDLNGARAQTGLNSFYRGDGIFKSVDGGETWTLLPATRSGTPHLTDPFDFVWDLVTFGEDGVFAATSAGLFKSTDGGASWTPSLQFGDSYVSHEIARSGDGTFYATVGGNGSANGIYRSVDGDAWENISPNGWPASTVRTVIAPALSNANAMYFFTETNPASTGAQQLRKYEAGQGWTDLSAGLPFNARMATFGGALMVLDIKPDDEDTIFLGAIDLFRSTDGGNSFEVISGTGAGFHVDQFAIAFYPSNPRRMIVGNDGGLYRTDNSAAATTGLSLDWDPLNNGYLTTQFYTTAIDHGTPGSEVVTGGTQDNGVVFIDSPDPKGSWDIVRGGDGAYTAITDGGDFLYFATAATFSVFRRPSATGFQQQTEITPASAQPGLWLQIFQLDPHDQKMMYLPSRQTLFRNSDLTGIPDQPNAGPTNINWDTVDHVNGLSITALGMSGATPRRLYYAGFEPDQSGRLMYLDNPHQGQPMPVDITAENFPNYPRIPFIESISVDPRDANKVMVVFPSYGVLSIYASDDGGQSWTPVSGNLEEYLDGTGSGPSVRWVTTLYVDDQPVYLAGTSVGLFSSTRLDGMNTVWTPEAPSAIGNVVVPMVAVRQSDGFVAAATYGNGIYTTYLTEVPSGGGSGNHAPSAVTATSLTDGEFITIGGAATPLDPSTPFEVTWDAASDPDGDPLTYRWQLSASQDFSSFILDAPSANGGRATRFETDLGSLVSMLDANGLSPDFGRPFYHRVVASDGTARVPSPPFLITLLRGTLVDTDEAETLPTGFAIDAAYPNPLATSTTIPYHLPKAGFVEAGVYNVRGQQVERLFAGQQQGGVQVLRWSPGALADGVYFVHIRFESSTQVRKVVVQR